MGRVERISVDVPADLAEALREAVAAGEHASVDEAVSQALEAWSLDRLAPGLGDEELGRLHDEGIAGGEPTQDAETFFAELHAWLDAEYPIEADAAARTGRAGRRA